MPLAHLQALEDLRGLVRAMYAAEASQKGHPFRLQKLAEAGNLLNLAISSAKRVGPFHESQAQRVANDAIKILGNLVELVTPLEPVLQAACDRAQGKRPRHDEREAKRLADRVRR